MLVLREVPWQRVLLIHVDGSLRAPVTGDLPRRVRKSIDRGDTRIVLDLSRIAYLDAAGIGELVHAYNTVAAANGSVWIVNASRRVRQILDRVGLLELLSDAPE